VAAAVAIAVLGSLAFIAWMIYRAVKEKSLTAHVVSYGISILAAVFTYAYFLSLDVDALLKIVVSIGVGVILIFVAASRQRRSRPS
jgi:hypothetical protein